MSLRTYQDLEGGYSNPTLANLLRVLSILGLSHRLADLVPLPEIPQTLATVHAARKRVRARKQRGQR
jgi:hypothetical protein